MNPLDRTIDAASCSHEAIRDLQTTHLRKHLAHCIGNSPFYMDRLGGSEIDVDGFSLEQLPSLPFTDKSDIEIHNDEFLAVPMEMIVDICLSSGTTGTPTRIMYTRRDMERLAYNEETAFLRCGVGAKDTVLLMCSMDRCFIAGLAYYSGLKKIGAAVVRSGANTLEGHAEIIRRIRPAVLVGVPSFIRRFALYLRDRRIAPEALGVSRVVCIGEPLRDRGLQPLPVCSEMESLWRARAFSTYASTEVVTTSCECGAQAGGHFSPDLAVMEIVDPNGTPLPPGEVGEVVITPLGTEGMPLIRFRTGDVSFLITGQCSCGSAAPRLGPILGRLRQMLKVRGTTLYPQAIFSVLEEIEGVAEYLVEATNKDTLSDALSITVAVNDPSCTADLIGRRLQARLRVKPEIVVSDPDSIRSRIYNPAFRKPVRFIDRRVKNG